jgi:Tfp pilus assembly protein PilF
VKVTPQQLAQYNLKIKEADALFLKGDYVSLKNAFLAYQDLLTFPGFQKKTGERYIKAAVIFGLREKELGILNDSTLNGAAAWIARNPDFSEFSRYVEIAQRIPPATQGIVGGVETGDKELDDYFEWVKVNVRPYYEHLKQYSVSSEFYAYLYVTFYSAYSYRLKEEKVDMSRFFSVFPDSRLLRYKLAVYPQADKTKLNTLIQVAPDFYEAYYFLGALDLGAGLMLSAETKLKKAYEYIPGSTSIVISLTKIYFATEEMEICLDYNDKALALAPNYRDALLGKAMSLWYLERYEESLSVLDRMLELGKYYIGETYYWMARNQNDQERLEAAKTNITRARDYLIGHAEVSTLDGIITFKLGNLKEAEKYFKETLPLPPADCDPYFYLGKIYGQWKQWKDSGDYFGQAAACNERTEASLNRRIQEIEKSRLAKARKDKFILKTKMKILQTRRAKATSQFNAAVGYFNAEMLPKAQAYAQLAAQHPSFKEEAQALIERIKLK